MNNHQFNSYISDIVTYNINYGKKWSSFAIIEKNYLNVRNNFNYKNIDSSLECAVWKYEMSNSIHRSMDIILDNIDSILDNIKQY